MAKQEDAARRSITEAVLPGWGYGRLWSMAHDRTSFLFPGTTMVSNPEVEALIKEHYSPLLAFVRSRLEFKYDAEDIVQETWIRSMSVLASGTVQNARAYLHRVARNLIVDKGEDRCRAGEVSIEDAILQAIPDPKVDIEHQFVVCEELRRIDAAIQAMPPRCRTVFLLARIEELSYAEIGRRLKISRQTVYEYMMRAMIILETSLKEN